ncbi:MAG: enoyl-CoA hydratase-related protein [Candidatus Acidiferrales bacterium]
MELASPDGLPRLSASLLEELAGYLDRLLRDPACEGIVIHGSEKCFATGAEISEIASLSGSEALRFARRGQLLFEEIAASPKPVVAAIAGYCLGGGLDLALACHRRLATPDAVLGHPGATLGLLTGWGGTQRLPRLVGRARALEILLTGETVGAEQAMALGLIEEIVAGSRLLVRAAERASQLAQASLDPLPRFD